MIDLDKTGNYLAFIECMEKDETLRNVELVRNENNELTNECVQTIAHLVFSNLISAEKEVSHAN